MNAAPAPLTALVARLREAELKPTAEELADALWLSRFVPAAASRRAGAEPPGFVGPKSADPSPAGSMEAPAPSSLRPRPAQHTRIELFGPAQTDGAPGGVSDSGLRTVPVPAAAALPDPLALQRALRPLQRYRPPMRLIRRELDEVATADGAADTGLVVPVLHAVRRREARLALVMDVSSSNVVWDKALDELRQVCERAGAFREVAVHHLRDGEPAPAQLGDPTGRQLTLVLSDCAGPMWRSGRMQRLLHIWASTAPVAVVQPLPQRMWRRTHLPARPGLLRRREGPAGRLEFNPRYGVPEWGIPVPVLALRRSSFEAWTRLVAGATGQSLNAAAGQVRARQEPAPGRTRTAQDIDAGERVRAFRRTASPAAAQLAVYLSAVPLVLPVMQLVQRAMLVRSGPDVLAEVLLSGLLKRDDHGPAEDGPSYTFLAGVREELLGQLGASNAALVLKHCSEYVETRYGRTVRNFPAMAAAFLTGSVDPRPAVSGAPDSRGLWAFAQVSAQVLRRLGGAGPTAPPGGPPGDGPAGLVAQARACLAHFGEYGTVRDLDAGVRLLGSATQAERRAGERAVLYGELAEALLRRWLVRPLPEDLRDALDAAQNAITGKPQAHLTLALVLEAMADEMAAGRLSPRLMPEWVRVQAAAEPVDTGLMAAILLSTADTSLAELTDSTPRTEGSRALRESAAAVRVRVLRRLAVTGAPYALRGPVRPEDWFTETLQIALTVVQLLLAAESRESALLVKGGLLLELARHYRGEGPVPRVADEEGRIAARAFADRADKDLHAGIDGLDWDAVPQAQLCRAWLDYADAIEFAHEDLDEDGRLRILQALDQARQHVGKDEEAEADCLLRMARILEQRYASTGGWAHRDSAIAAWTSALPLLPPGDPRRAVVLTSLGRQLTERGVDKDAAVDVYAAVRALRGAIDETHGRDPELPLRRALLGHAYIERFRAEEAAADLHEADWTLGAAARAAGNAELAAYAWWYRALASALLARRTESSAGLGDAAGHFRRAAAEPGSGDLLERAVTAQWMRATRLERTAGPERAAEEHRAVLLMLMAAGADPEAAGLIREELTRLDASEAPEARTHLRPEGT
ncbi:metallophosphoesterase [Streptomyces lunaelactis]|uniref:SAV_2336 N-terminal domain-related protein n=1 Tax=Streptomyces lunaelactis TaxID=1535768 RepID=UPI001584F6BC|nr:SAV_2336 N-terminal domain-related protein [Streptomyces lunaelactis]NUL06437.1 metallophosphoesterase [Streptomyces lunaelactis]